MPYRDMPEPLPLSKVLGPSVILAGLGVGSGEYIIWPFIASTVGVGFLWAAVVSVTIQYFLNMEIERYTLATGETAVAGFVRFWKPWGMWRGWATSGVTILTFLMGGGNVTHITIGILIAAGAALTVSLSSIKRWNGRSSSRWRSRSCFWPWRSWPRLDCRPGAVFHRSSPSSAGSRTGTWCRSRSS